MGVESDMLRDLRVRFLGVSMTWFSENDLAEYAFEESVELEE